MELPRLESMGSCWCNLVLNVGCCVVEYVLVMLTIPACRRPLQSMPLIEVVPIKVLTGIGGGGTASVAAGTVVDAGVVADAVGV